jgi:hypothetical protein
MTAWRLTRSPLQAIWGHVATPRVAWLASALFAFLQTGCTNCDLNASIAGVATPETQDCGRYVFSDELGSEDAGAQAAGVACALAAQDAGSDFKIVIGFGGVDAVWWSGFVRARGASYEFNQLSANPGCSHLGDVEGQSCSDFDLSYVPSYPNLSDGGVPVLSCVDAGKPVTVCSSGCPH